MIAWVKLFVGDLRFSRATYSSQDIVVHTYSKNRCYKLTRGAFNIYVTPVSSPEKQNIKTILTFF